MSGFCIEWFLNSTLLCFLLKCMCCCLHIGVLLIFTCLGVFAYIHMSGWAYLELISGREEMGIFFEDLNANRHAEPNSFSSIFDLWGLF